MLSSLSGKVISVFIVSAALAIAAGATSAQAGKLKILYSFCADKDPESGICSDGSSPMAPVVRDANGNLFGTASRGGAFDQGTVFEISGTTHTTLYNFCRRTNCKDGAVPLAGVVFDKAGNLYGTTQNGGPASSGIAYELTPAAGGWKETVLYDFCSKAQCADGGDVVAGLTMDGAGNLYGTTLSGGVGDGGTAFELTRHMTSGKWSEHVIYAFCALSNCADGEFPNAAVIRDSDGNLYGTTTSGGQNGGGGTVFKLSQNPKTRKWRERVLYSFCSQPNCEDGAGPVAPLFMDKSGNLYGTAQTGGIENPGSGTVFELAFKKSTGHYKFNVLYTFCQANASNCNDGDHPQGGIVLDKSGNLYGTTSSTLSENTQFSNGGTVYRVTPAGVENLLVRFCQSVCKNGTSDGIGPDASLIMDASGNLYGTTGFGGGHGSGGEVFEVLK